MVVKENKWLVSTRGQLPFCNHHRQQRLFPIPLSPGRDLREPITLCRSIGEALAISVDKMNVELQF